MYVSGKGIGNVSQQRDDTRQFCAIISGLGHKKNPVAKTHWSVWWRGIERQGSKDKACSNQILFSWHLEQPIFNWKLN